MSDKPSTLTREALYTLVWSKPMRELAPKLNISDTGLAKLCKGHNIPSPPQGHWLKIEHGRKVNQPPLPVALKSMPSIIQLPKTKTALDPTMPSAPLPTVCKKKTTHRLIKQCGTDFKGATINDYGRLVSTNRADLDVSRAALSHSLLILNTVIHSVEARSHSVCYSIQQKAFELSIDGECMCLSIKETATRSDLILTTEQQKSLNQHAYCFGKKLGLHAKWKTHPVGQWAQAMRYPIIMVR